MEDNFGLMDCFDHSLVVTEGNGGSSGLDGNSDWIRQICYLLLSMNHSFMFSNEIHTTHMNKATKVRI